MLVKRPNNSLQPTPVPGAVDLKRYTETDILFKFKLVPFSCA